MVIAGIVEGGEDGCLPFAGHGGGMGGSSCMMGGGDRYLRLLRAVHAGWESFHV